MKYFLTNYRDFKFRDKNSCMQFLQVSTIKLENSKYSYLEEHKTYS